MNLQIIEQQGQRVLTTAQIAEAYGTEVQIIVNNFNRNKDRYKIGKHYFLLEGDRLRDLRAKNQIDLSPNINKLYLWTEKGAWLHAKSLNTDKAWEAYEALVDDYYRDKELIAQQLPNSNPEKAARAEAMLINAKTRRANLLVKMAQTFKDQLSPESVQLLLAGAAETAIGKPLLPKPPIDVHFTATEIAEELGISANMIGRLANKNNLKTSEYGMWVLDKSPHSSKQVKSFVYNEQGRQKLVELTEQPESKEGSDT